MDKWTLRIPHKLFVLTKNARWWTRMNMHLQAIGQLEVIEKRFDNYWEVRLRYAPAHASRAIALHDELEALVAKARCSCSTCKDELAAL